MYKTAIFDLDGTLLNTLGDLADSVNATLTRFGYPTRTEDEVRCFVGNGVRLLIARALPAGETDPRFEEVLAAFRTHYAQNSQTRTAPYAGILALLTRLCEAGVRVAVVSNKFDAAVKGLCATYFGDTVEVAIGETPEVARKPAPDTVFAAMRRLDATVADTVYIGDSEVDVATARAAGIPCISVLWGFRDRVTLAAAGADTFATTVGELEKMLLTP